VKIGIYNEASGGKLGGSDALVAVLAEGVGRFHEVDLVHHLSSLSTQQLAQFASVDLSRVQLRYVDRQRDPFGHSTFPWRRYRDARQWHAALSQPYDLFVNVTHGIPPFCHAPHGVLLVLFPLFRPPYVTPTATQTSDKRFLVWRHLRRSYYTWEWKARLDTYQTKVAISRYAQEWTERLWGVKCQVLYPPATSRQPANEKLDRIISVGRFSFGGHRKRQLEMVQSFAQLRRELNDKVDYACIGGLGDSHEDLAYFEEVDAAARSCGADVRTNVASPELAALLAKAKVFWHATGFGDDTEQSPELAEHFGIAVVEAMAAGCVPVVVNKGAHPEIVQHGVNGFLWNTLDELREHTHRLMADDELRKRMAEAAKARAREFSREAFIDRALAVLSPSGSHLHSATSA